MGKYRMGPPEDLVLALKRHVKSDDFVETGTYQGNTAAWAAAYFDCVTTIELSSDYHARAKVRFEKQANVRALQGSSASVLRTVVQAMTSPGVFWLDAHWSGLDTAGREAECPLLAEIAVINASEFGHIVLVDDACLFCAPPPRPHRADQWPDLGATTSALSDRGRRYVVIVEDVFIAVPVTERDFVNGLLQDQFAVTSNESRLARWWKKVRA